MNEVIMADLFMMEHLAGIVAPRRLFNEGHSGPARQAERRNECDEGL